MWDKSSPNGPFAMLKKTILWSLATAVVLFAVLVVHIAMVSDKRTQHLANMQLARIDFAQPIAEDEASIISRSMADLPGIQHARVNIERTNIVYSYDRGMQQQETVFRIVDLMSSAPCSRVIISADQAAKGCPAMAQRSALAMLTGWVQRTFN